MSTIAIDGNPMKQIRRQIVEQGANKILSYLRDRFQEGKDDQVEEWAKEQNKEPEYTSKNLNEEYTAKTIVEEEKKEEPAVDVVMKEEPVAEVIKIEEPVQHITEKQEAEPQKQTPVVESKQSMD